MYRAPRSPERLTEYWWFCLLHVRTYNAAWNYYAGMSDSQVEADIRRDTVWQRPSWPLGAHPEPLREGTDNTPLGLATTISAFL